MQVQTLAKNIGDYGCLFFCYLYCSGMYTNKGEALKFAVDAMDKGLIDDTCTVLDAAALLHRLTGRRYNITKKAINTISDIKDKTPIKFAHNGYGHWVVVENGKIIFNSLDKSVCVDKGQPVDARIITLR